MYALLRPKYAIPVHGEYRHLMAQAQIAQSMDIPKENIKILKCGEVLQLTQDSAEVVETLVGSFSLVLVAPATAFVSAWLEGGGRGS